ncbi:L-serine dehydratase [Streptosporangium canum]|uniref:L-serine dehydratase n=1 Tax=Streptosporangium canum TaxID=324952 RepID=A0A1I3XJ31_9ACTN|nr:L-serine dehydratase [Streptosporangium canum]
MTVGVFDLFKVGIGPSSSHSLHQMRRAIVMISRLVSVMGPRCQSPY